MCIAIACIVTNRRIKIWFWIWIWKREGANSTMKQKSVFHGVHVKVKVGVFEVFLIKSILSKFVQKHGFRLLLMNYSSRKESVLRTKVGSVILRQLHKIINLLSSSVPIKNEERYQRLALIARLFRFYFPNQFLSTYSNQVPTSYLCNLW